jgi:hypothetical protein
MIIKYIIFFLMNLFFIFNIRNQANIYFINIIIIFFFSNTISLREKIYFIYIGIINLNLFYHIFFSKFFSSLLLLFIFEFIIVSL